VRVSDAIGVGVAVDRRRRRSAVLSLLAACVTFALFAWAFLARDADASRSWKVWLLTIAVPPIALSLVAAAQYRWTPYSGAGAAATAVYWLMVVLLMLRAGPAYVPGAVLQTVAWFVSRPRVARPAAGPPSSR
jgi:hypothetical protein